MRNVRNYFNTHEISERKYDRCLELNHLNNVLRWLLQADKIIREIMHSRSGNIATTPEPINGTVLKERTTLDLY